MAEKLLIHPDLAKNANVEWPDVNLAYSDHQRLDARSFAMHRLVAAKLLANPTLVNQARGTLERWKAQAAKPVHLEWERVLAGSLEEIVDFLLSSGQEATRLRQSTPFTDILTLEERAVIYDAFQNQKTGSIRALAYTPPGGKQVSIDKMSR
jgi:hypothetical protein